MEIKIDEELRRPGGEGFERLGLSEEEAITLFYKRTIAAGRMPFGAAAAEQGKQKKKMRMNERFAEWDAF